MTLGAKIITTTLIAIVCCVVVALTVQRHVIERQGIDLIRDTMRASIIEAESVRQSVSELGEKGAFDRTKLLEQYRASGDLRNSTLYRTIPVVAAWNAAGKVAVDQGFAFRVPKRQARNPQNKPTSDEEVLLDHFERENLPEYFLADRSTNTILYARPVILTADCLHCHGDPANSPSHDGKDILGFPMENWHTGEVHGAFVLKTDFTRVDATVRRGMLAALGWLLPLTFGIAGGIVLFNQRNIVRPLRRSIESLGLTGAQTSVASEQISSASQSLADGASEQAASLEETSASLEELTGTTRSNTESAERTNQLAANTRVAAEAGSVGMHELNVAMADIKASGDNIAKIIKTIDEIAFQTNILALNAAVEAARAGESGMGFAVVAEEVRALAQRSAEAARETAERIDDSIAKSQRGASLCGRVETSLQDILDKVRSMETNVGDIAAASREQNRGIQQINQAVTQMGQITQVNAGSAEESAAAATELSAQASALYHAIESLESLVGHSSGSHHAKPAIAHSSLRVTAAGRGKASLSRLKTPTIATARAARK